MSNAITIELCAEDRARIEHMIVALEGLTKRLEQDAAPVMLTGMPTHPATAAQTPENGDAPAEVETVQPEPETAENGQQGATDVPAEVTPPAPTYTQADLVNKITALIGAGKKAEARAVVLDYAASVSDLPEDKYPEIMERLTALEG